MKCSKCGEECKEGQIFCLKCGNPIEVVKNMSDIEKEISNEVEEAMQVTAEFKIPSSVAVNVPSDEEENQTDHSEREQVTRTISKQNDPRTNNERIHKKVRTRQENRKESQKEEKGSRDKKPQEVKKQKHKRREAKKNQSKKSILLSIVLVFVIVGVAALLSYQAIFARTNKEFNNYYNNAEKLYQAGNYQAASSEYIRADKKAYMDSQHIKALDKLYKCYLGIDGKESEAISTLETLLQYDDKNIEYYEQLIILYQNTGRTDTLEKFMSGITDEDIKKKLEAYDFATPTADVKSGTYSEPITVTLKSLAGNTIYYTVDGKEPDTKSKKYEHPLVFGKNADFDLKAIAVSEKGITSEIMTEHYVINAVSNPEVSPSSGDYTEVQKIKIEVPENCKAYYTLDGTEPTNKSEEYTGDLDMPIGNHLVSVVIYNSAGVKSPVTQVVYNLTLTRSYSYNSCIQSLKKKLKSKGILEQEDGTFSDGSYMYYSYVETKVVDGKEYYIVKAIKFDKNENQLSESLYGMGCSDGEVYRAKKKNDTYKFSRSF